MKARRRENTSENEALGPLKPCPDPPETLQKPGPERGKTHKNRPRPTKNAARPTRCSQEAPKSEKGANVHPRPSQILGKFDPLALLAPPSDWGELLFRFELGLFSGMITWKSQ